MAILDRLKRIDRTGFYRIIVAIRSKTLAVIIKTLSFLSYTPALTMDYSDLSTADGASLSGFGAKYERDALLST